jgi:hypothetical protein
VLSAAIITVKGDGKLPFAPLDNLISRKARDVARLSCSELGLSPGELKFEPTAVLDIVFPRPATRKTVTPDSSLPAFYRILKLLEGGVSRRQGKRNSREAMKNWQPPL